MSALPTYNIPLSVLDRIEERFAAKDLRLSCVKPRQLLKSGGAFYTEWEITDFKGLRVIMWAHEHISDAAPNNVAVVTVGTPSGRKGLKLLEEVKVILSGLNEATSEGEMPARI